MPGRPPTPSICPRHSFGSGPRSSTSAVPSPTAAAAATSRTSGSARRGATPCGSSTCAKGTVDKARARTAKVGVCGRVVVIPVCAPSGPCATSVCAWRSWRDPVRWRLGAVTRARCGGGVGQVCRVWDVSMLTCGNVDAGRRSLGCLLVSWLVLSCGRGVSVSGLVCLVGRYAAIDESRLAWPPMRMDRPLGDLTVTLGYPETSTAAKTATAKAATAKSAVAAAAAADRSAAAPYQGLSRGLSSKLSCGSAEAVRRGLAGW